MLINKEETLTKLREELKIAEEIEKMYQELWIKHVKTGASQIAKTNYDIATRETNTWLKAIDIVLREKEDL